MKLAHKWMMGHSGGTGVPNLIGKQAGQWSYVRTWTAPDSVEGFDMSPDGTKLTVLLGPPSSRFETFTMSTPFDLSTATSAAQLGAGGLGSLRGVSYGKDGLIIYSAKFAGTAAAKHWSLDTSDYVIPTSNPQTNESSVNHNGYTVTADLAEDGIHLYKRRLSPSGTHILRYSINPANDVTGGVDEADQTHGPGVDRVQGVSISPDGTEIWCIDSVCTPRCSTLSTAYDLDSAGAWAVGSSLTEPGTDPNGMKMMWQGGMMYIHGGTTNGDNVYQYEYTGTDV